MDHLLRRTFLSLTWSFKPILVKEPISLLHDSCSCPAQDAQYIKRLSAKQEDTLPILTPYQVGLLSVCDMYDRVYECEQMSWVTIYLVNEHPGWSNKRCTNVRMVIWYVHERRALSKIACGRMSVWTNIRGSYDRSMRVCRTTLVYYAFTGTNIYTVTNVIWLKNY